MKNTSVVQIVFRSFEAYSSGDLGACTDMYILMFVCTT